MSVKSGVRGGQLIGPPLPFHGPGNRSSRAVRTMAPKSAGAPSCWKVRPSASAILCGNTELCSISISGGALVEEAGSNNSGRRGAARDADSGGCPLGHVDSHCPKSCHCGGLQHRVCEKWPRRRRHDWMTLAFMQSQLVAVRCCHLPRIHVTKSWTDFALNFRYVLTLWLSSE
jgi:hypothetical protein